MCFQINLSPFRYLVYCWGNIYNNGQGYALVIPIVIPRVAQDLHDVTWLELDFFGPASIDMPDEEDVEEYVVSDEADRTEPRHQTTVAIVGIVIMIAFVVVVSYICYQLYYV